MKFESSKALDFEYLLLEFYKTLNIQEREVVIILMIEHLLKQGNDFITSDLLALKMKYDIKEIDASLSILFTKGYLEYKEVNNELHTSLDSLKKSLFKTFEKTIFTEEEISKNEIIEEKRKIIFDAQAALQDPNADKGILKAVGFELMWLRNKREFYKMIFEEDAQRLTMLENRYKTLIEEAGGTYE